MRSLRSVATSTRTFLNKTLIIERGSIRGSVLQLSAAAIGAGVLNLPFIIAMTGFLLGSILIMIGALAGAWSLKNVLYCAELKKSVSYTSLVRRICGSKLDRIMTILIIISISGTCISE